MGSLTWLSRNRPVALAVGLLVATAIVVSGFWWWSKTAESLGPIDPEDDDQVALGQAIYAAQCASCHGDKLQGQADWQTRRADGRLPAPPHDETGHTWRHGDELLFGMTKFGLGPYAPAGYQSDMPAFEGKLTDAQIRAALAYIKSTWPDRIRFLQEKATLKAQK